MKNKNSDEGEQIKQIFTLYLNVSSNKRCWHSYRYSIPNRVNLYNLFQIHFNLICVPYEMYCVIYQSDLIVWLDGLSGWLTMRLSAFGSILISVQNIAISLYSPSLTFSLIVHLSFALSLSLSPAQNRTIFSSSSLRMFRNVPRSRMMLVASIKYASRICLHRVHQFAKWNQ